MVCSLSVMTYRRRLTDDGESILSNGAMRAALTQMTLSWRSTMSDRPTPDDFRGKVFRDREHIGDWRVEKLNDDGESYDVAIRPTRRSDRNDPDQQRRGTARHPSPGRASGETD